MKVKLLLTLLIMSMGISYAQSQTIRGTVTGGKDNSPVPGVNVLIKGSQTGTTTDESGNFSLQTTDLQRVIVFSFIGYKTIEVPLEGRTILTVNLDEDVSALDEVVVTALGIKRD